MRKSGFEYPPKRADAELEWTEREQSMKDYFKMNLIPLGIEMLFIISCFIIPSEYYIYSNFVFYMSLLVYFVVKKNFSLKEWGANLKQGRKFWVPVWITVFFFMAAFAVTTVLESIFPDYNTGMIALRRDNWFRLFIFAISTIILPPVVEELFYRKNLILSDSQLSVGSKWITVATMVFSMILYAAEHSLSVWGIFLTMIWAFPLSVSYIKTKNVFIPMTAHLIVNLFGNGADVIFTIRAML